MWLFIDFFYIDWWFYWLLFVFFVYNKGGFLEELEVFIVLECGVVIDSIIIGGVIFIYGYF